MLIESLIKRKGGTVVEFGYKPKVTKFHFKPISDDMDAPHVCEVDEKSPYLGKMLAVTEGFRVFGQEDDSAESAPGAVDPYAEVNPYADQFDNLHLVNPDAVDGRFLAAFATDVLSVPASNKAKLVEMLKNDYGIEAIASRETVNSLIRMALAKEVEMAKAEAEQVSNMQK